MRYLMIALLSLASLSAPLHADTSSKVVIVGAGLAGLTTAYRLQEEGYDVSVYEARGRVGGRILTAKLKGVPIELGAQNISDGGDATNLNDLIDEFALTRTRKRIPLAEAYFDKDKIISLKELFKDQKCDPRLKEKIEQAVSTSQNMQQVLSKLFEPDDPLYKISAVKLAAYEGATVDKLSPVYSETLYHMLSGGLCAAHPAQEDHSVDFVSIEGGNATLTEKMAEELSSKIQLNKVLSKVAKGEKSGFILRFKDGSQVHANILVLAIPCSIYKEITFDEGIIPSDRLAAIQNIQYGSNSKIVLSCPRSSSLKYPILLGDEIISFLDNNHILTLFCTGTAASFSKESLDRSYEKAKPMVNLGFADLCSSSQSPVFAEDKEFVAYGQPVGYSWPNDPYVKGSYAYIAPGQEEIMTEIIEVQGEKFKALFAPIHESLYFVGEHTSILLDVPGTMESACESGERVARVIAEQLAAQD